MVAEGILGRLPELLQSETRESTDRVDFDSNQQVYTIPKAPVLEVMDVFDASTTYTEGTDYELHTDSDGLYIEIDWSIGGDNPTDGTEFIVESRFKTIIKRYSSAMDDELEIINGKLDAAIESHQVNDASGDDLDQIGAMFGQLGARRGRDDQDYRQYLRSIVQSFNGRGSVQGLQFAIASAIGTDPSNVEIIENFSELSYTVQISNTQSGFISQAINDLAELADPSVVSLDQAIIIILDGGVLIGGNNVFVDEDEEGLGSFTLSTDPPNQQITFLNS